MRKLIPAYLVVLLLAIGCGGSQKPAPDSGGNYSGGGDSIDALGDGGGANTGGDKSDVGLEPAASTKIDATVKSWAEIEQLIASKKGRVVVVDFWATYWTECVAELPHLVQLHEQYQDKIACISVSLDYNGEDGMVPDSVVAEVKETLVAEKIAVENVISSDSDLAVMERLDIAIPAVFVYDTEGKLFQKFSANQDAFNYKDNVNPAVAKLLQ